MTTKRWTVHKSERWVWEQKIRGSNGIWLSTTHSTVTYEHNSTVSYKHKHCKGLTVQVCPGFQLLTISSYYLVFVVYIRCGIPYTLCLSIDICFPPKTTPFKGKGLGLWSIFSSNDMFTVGHRKCGHSYGIITQEQLVCTKSLAIDQSLVWL